VNIRHKVINNKHATAKLEHEGQWSLSNNCKL